MNEVKGKANVNVNTLIGIIAGLVVMFMIQQFFFSTPSVDSQLMNAASELNKHCPIYVNKYTRFDNSIASTGKVFQFDYTLLNVVKDSIDTARIIKQKEPEILNFVRTSPALKIHREHDVTLNFAYRDKNGKYLFTISIGPEKYKK
jgi:hypothetical protein